MTVISLGEQSEQRAKAWYAEFPNVEFRDVWQKNDAQAEADAIAFWHQRNILPQGVDASGRAKELCVVAYEGSKVLAVSTVTIDMLRVVRTKMAFFRALVNEDNRSQKLLLPLTYAIHDAMARYGQAHPEMKIGGTAAVVAAPNSIYKPIGSAEMILVGYSAANEPVLVRWFDHFRM